MVTSELRSRPDMLLESVTRSLVGVLTPPASPKRMNALDVAQDASQ